MNKYKYMNDAWMTVPSIYHEVYQDHHLKIIIIKIPQLHGIFDNKHLHAAATFFGAYESVKTMLLPRVDPSLHSFCFMAAAASGEAVSI